MANSGTFKKGDKRPRRPKGVPNKLTTALKDMVLQSLADLGGVEYLKAQAVANPTAYMTLVGKVLPLQVKQGGDDPQVPRVVHNYTIDKPGATK